jgi:hypothetical protein
MATDAPVAEIADTVTKATYDETKARADDAAAQLAAAQAKLQAYETRERAQLQSYQPAMEGLVKELSTEFATPENKSHFESFGEWTRNCHERPNLDTQMQLGTIIHACASKLKRTREDASVQSATSDQLASALKENERMKSENDALRQRTGELDTSLKEMQENAAKLQLQLEKAGALQEKFDFSKTASREEDAPAKEEDGVKKSTENASKMTALPQFSACDALAGWISSTVPSGNARFMPADGNHALLSSAHSGANIVSALRPM